MESGKRPFQFIRSKLNHKSFAVYCLCCLNNCKQNKLHQCNTHCCLLQSHYLVSSCNTLSLLPLRDESEQAYSISAPQGWAETHHVPENLKQTHATVSNSKFGYFTIQSNKAFRVRVEVSTILNCECADVLLRPLINFPIQISAPS